MFPHPATRRGGRSRLGRHLALLAAPLLAMPLLASTATAEPSLAPARLGEPLGAPVTVTLITGDVVTVIPGSGATVEPGPGREHITFLQADGGTEDLTVMPSDAGKFVSEGKLDKRLFDISYLIDEGYDDATSADLPLLFDGEPAQVRATAASESGAVVTQELPKLGLTAVSQRRDKARATGLWTNLTKAKPAGGPSTQRANEATSWWPEGVDKIWLDAKLHVALDQSVPQVGAPAAWDLGYTGEGVTVAVLDSGIDANHPDLAGQVIGERNFTPEPSPADLNGHGTHVASTIAGTGAASGGTYKGVAPGAKLLNGKVCNIGGQCPTSWILAGMQWAATSGADVINMSLGGGATDGTDPLSTAVNTLSEQHDVLFVISAGNDGPSPQTVSSPGTADAALTVAAVDKNDQLAAFSSRGPRLGNHAIKPDIAAPGVGIAAARGQGTSLGTPVNDRYTRLNGTSMAAPHVVGGAALLAQRHPDWNAQQLKAGLMGTATQLADLTAFEIGAGRLDVHRAVTQQVHTTTPSVSFGLVQWPHSQPPTTKPVIYRNDSASPVTLDLAVTAINQNRSPAPDSLFDVSPSRITVPAGGTAEVNLTLVPNGVGTGTYGGNLTATDGTVTIQTAVGADLEPESYNLTVNLLDRNGNPPTAETAWPVAFNIHDYATARQYLFLPSGHTLRLPARNYFVEGLITTARPDKADNRAHRLDDLAEVIHPEYQLTGDAVLTLDARQTRKVQVTVDRPTARLFTLQSSMAVKMPPGSQSTYYVYQTTAHSPFNALGQDIYVGSVGSSDKFFHAVRAQLTEPLIRLDVNGRRGVAVEVFYADDHNNPRAMLLGTHRMKVVHGGSGTPEELAAVDATGKLVVLDLPRAQDFDLLNRTAAVRAAGGRAVLLDRSPLDRPFISAGVVPALPILLAADPQRTQLVTLARRGDLSVTTHGVISSPYQYNLFFPTEGQVPAQPTFHPRNKELGLVEADYRYTGAFRAITYRETHYAGRSFGTAYFVTSITAEPERRTEYYTPGPAQWARRTEGPGGEGPILRTTPVAYKPGVRYRLTELQAVLGPSFATPHPTRPAWVFRDGNTMNIDVPMFNDTRPGHYSTPGARTTGYTRLYRNGTLIGETTVTPARGTFTVPPGHAQYRLEVGAIPPNSWQISTAVESAWTFTSTNTSAPTALQLMTIRFEPKLNEHNQARAGKKIDIPVRVEHQPGSTDAPITQLAVAVSFDHGTTWHPVSLKPKKDQWIATITNPAHGAVTLRATATDAFGNNVQQTIKDAYLIR